MKYKIAVYLNRIPTGYDIMSDFNKAKEYHARHGVDIEFTFKNISVTGYTSVLNTIKSRKSLSSVSDHTL